MTRNRLYVFTYDIPGDRERRRMAKALEKEGLRVQESVFEVRATHGEALRLGRRLKPLLGRGGSLRIYHVPEAALRRCMAFGGAPMPGPGDYVMF